MSIRRTKLRAPADIVAVSVGGQEYSVVKGTVEVPEDIAGTLTAIGYEPLVEPARRSGSRRA